MDVAEVKAENEALLNRYELFSTNQEEEKSKIRAKVSVSCFRMESIRSFHF